MSRKKLNQDTLTAKMNQLQKDFIENLKNTSVDSLSNTAKRKVAKTLKKVMDGNAFDATKQVESTDVKYSVSASQNEIPLKKISKGVICTRDGKYLGLVEIIPLNFYKKTREKQDRIIANYSRIFSMQLHKFKIKIMSESSNAEELIDHLLINCKRQDNEKILDGLYEYIEYLQRTGAQGRTSKRFFFIFEYKSEEGKTNTNFEEIQSWIEQRKNEIVQIMNDCGNACVTFDNYADEKRYLTKVYYTYFNRLSQFIEGFESRIDRMEEDYKMFTEETGIEKYETYADLVAPKGLRFDNRRYVFMDGMFYAYIGIDGDSWPTHVPQSGEGRCWVDIFNLGSVVDVDIISKKLPKETTILAIKGINFVKGDMAKSLMNKSKQDKAENLLMDTKSNQIVYTALEKQNDELYDTAIILTIRAYTVKELFKNVKAVQRYLKNTCKIHTEDSFLRCEDYFAMTMPFCYITPVFRELKHQILASQMCTMYCYTTFEQKDPDGFVLGIMNEKNNNSIVSINNFNRLLYKNGNMVILGSSGSGKTITEQIMGRRMMFNGKRCFFVIPKKGFEYEDGCKDIDGTYISLVPGSKDCVNIFDIYPEGTFDEREVGEEVRISKNKSLLTKKISNLIVWLQLVVGETPITRKQFSLLNTGLISIYREYGITEDNNSIFVEGTKKLKKFPIIEDLYNFCKKHEELENIGEALDIFVYGTCANMNGQTNVDLSKEYTVFDVEEEEISSDLLASFIYAAFEHIYTNVKAHSESRDIIFLDEVWKMLINKQCAEQVQNMVRIVRGYKGATVMASQQLSDFLGEDTETGKYGRAVLGNSEISILLGMKETDLAIATPLYKLTKEEQEKILSAGKGEAILISNGDRLDIKVEATPKEAELLFRESA